MDDNFKLRAALKSDEELHNCIDNREKYLPETVEAAVAELQHRGVEFSDEELKVISEDMQARREIANAGTGIFGVFNTGWDNNMVDDPEAPPMFSKRATFAFSVLFSVFFGSILMAINVGKTKNRGSLILVLMYGIGFTMAQGVLLRAYALNPIVSLGSSIIGAYIMDNLFWSRYIGNATLYKSRPIWVPLLIGVAIVVAYLLLINYYGKLPV